MCACVCVSYLTPPCALPALVVLVGPHYATVCCTVANALVDIAYNTSSVTPQHPFRNFTGLIANVLTHNYTAAAESLSASDWCAKSPVACADDVKAVATGCPNATSSFSR